MGYRSFLLLGCKEANSLEDGDCEKMNRIYQQLCKKYPDFPTFGNSYQGPDFSAHPDIFTKFSKKNPGYTFYVYYFCFDGREIEIYTYRGGRLVNKREYNDSQFLTTKLGKFRIHRNFSFGETWIDNDITCILNPDYCCD